MQLTDLDTYVGVTVSKT